MRLGELAEVEECIVVVGLELRSKLARTGRRRWPRSAEPDPAGQWFDEA